MYIFLKGWDGCYVMVLRCYICKVDEMYGSGNSLTGMIVLARSIISRSRIDKIKMQAMKS